MTPEEQALLEASYLPDEGARYAYSDWLEEQGRDNEARFWRWTVGLVPGKPRVPYIDRYGNVLWSVFIQGVRWEDDTRDSLPIYIYIHLDYPVDHFSEHKGSYCKKIPGWINDGYFALLAAWTMYELEEKWAMGILRGGKDESTGEGSGEDV